MRKKDINELENPESWDFEHAVRKPPIKDARVVVSVAFAREDFERVAKYAEELGRRTSEFIREAALERASQPPRESRLTSQSSHRLQVFTLRPAPTTRVSASAWPADPEPAVTGVA